MSESRKRILGDGYYSESSAEDAEPILGNEDAAQTSSPSPEVIASRKRVKNINESIHGLKLSASSALNLASDDIIHIDIDFDEPGLIEYNVRPSASSPSNNKDIVIAALQPVSANSMYCPGISGCRHVEEYELLNKIEEGAYGVVYRAREKKTKKMMALKRLKMEKERDGFPITSLREINMLLKCRNHPNIVNLQEVVVDATMDKIFMVMEYVEHDMKSLMNTMKAKSKKFTLPQVKTLLKQLLSGCQYMHEEFVIHRDLKTSNLLMSHNGVLKIGDFGLAREYGEPLRAFTPVVVTLWYRSPELLLRTQKYSTAVDMWSVGCIFAEFANLQPLFPGSSEIDQLNKIFLEIGTPNENIWPGYTDIWAVKKFDLKQYSYNQLHKQFGTLLETQSGMKLLTRLLAPCPERRISAFEALKSDWFEEKPFPLPPNMFPTWPAKSEQNKKPPPQKVEEEKLPEMSAEQLKLLSDLNVDVKHAAKSGFTLKFGAQKKSR